MATSKSVATDSTESWKLLKKRKFEVKLGKSFTNKESNAFHTISYDFKPKSIDSSKPAKLKVVQDGVEVTIPSIQAESPEDVTVFRGGTSPCPKECILTINLKTGEAILDRVTNKVILKVVRERRMKPSGKERSQSPNLLVKNAPNNNLGANSSSSSLVKNKKASKGKQPQTKKRAVEGANPAQPKPSGVVKTESSKKESTVSEKKFLPVPAPQQWRQLEVPQKRPNTQSTSSSGSSSSSDSEADEKVSSLQQMPTFRPLSPVVGVGGGTEPNMQPIRGVSDQVKLSSSSSSDSTSSSDSDSSSSSSDGNTHKVVAAATVPKLRSMSILNDDLGLSSSDSD